MAGDLSYGMTYYGDSNGNGVIYRFNLQSHRVFRAAYFSPLGANGNNEDGAIPLRAIVIGTDGRLYGTTRLGGQSTSEATARCLVAREMDL